MPDNWGYVFSAYGIAAVVLFGYWRHLQKRSRELLKAGKERMRS